MFPDGVTVVEGQFDDDQSVQVEVTMRKGEPVMYKGQMVNHELEGEGTVYAEDHMDDGSRISLRITIDASSGDAVFDFSGTDPEV